MLQTWHLPVPLWPRSVLELRVKKAEGLRTVSIHTLCFPTSEHIPEGTVPIHSLELVFISFEICMWNAVFGVGFIQFRSESP